MEPTPDVNQQALIGEATLDARMVTQLLHQLANRRAGADQAILEPLTRRELEVLELIVEGLTNREIGQRLYLVIGTVKAHMAHLIAKMGVSDRTQAAVRAVRLALAPPPRTTDAGNPR